MSICAIVATVDDDLLTTPQAAEVAGVVPNTIRNWTAAGRLVVAATTGRRDRIKLYRRADVLAAAEQRTDAAA